MKRDPINYLADLYHGATQYPCGWLKPRVALGSFTADENGKHQQLFFRELLTQGFRRTLWQLVFPGQTAGLIKPIPTQTDGVDEYHVRFYDDGVIDCELEVARFHSMHWVGPRRHGIELLENLLERSRTITREQTKNRIRQLFGTKNYTEHCVREKIAPEPD